jgi:phage terminase large subunit GpA-like protein
MLEELLGRRYTHASGLELGIQSSCIDSAGHRTTLVYDFADKHKAKRVHAVIGRDGDRPIVSSPSPRRWGKKQRKVPLYTIGVDAAKTLWMDRFKVGRPQAESPVVPGYVHVPVADWADDELAAQLTSEKKVRRYKKGVPVVEWVKTRPRNEMLDCAVYGLAALRLLNAKLSAMAQSLVAKAAALPPPAPPPAPMREVALGVAPPPPPPAPPPAAPTPNPASRGGRRIARAGYLYR